MDLNRLIDYPCGHFRGEQFGHGRLAGIVLAPVLHGRRREHQLPAGLDLDLIIERSDPLAD